MGNVATRLLSLILLLQTRPSWKAAELSRELNVSERTVFRYMEMLDEMGIPIYSERGPYGGFSLVRGYKLPPLIFSPEEATVLYMGAHLVRDVWGQTYEDAATSVMAKLDNVLPDDMRQEVAATRRSLVVENLKARDYRPWESMIHSLRQCIRDHRCAHIVYRGRTRQEDTQRVLEPYALMLKWGLWYLVGFCRLRQDLRTFRVDRLREVTPLEETFTMPRDFSVREYLAANLDIEPAFKVVIHMDAAVASQVWERHGHWMEIDNHPDGSITASYGASGLDWTVGWVLRYGSAARVLEPPELIEQVKATARGALQQYEE